MERINSVFSYKPMWIMGYNLLIHPLIKVSMMIADQFAIELGVGGPFVFKAPTLEVLYAHPQVLSSLLFR